MYIVSGYEVIKSKDGSVFTKVYISQALGSDFGYKPFPIPYMSSGSVNTFVPGSTVNVVLDQSQDGKLFISSLTLA